VLLLLAAGCATASHRPADDLSLSTQVKIALLADARLGAQRLDVSTHDGRVTLSGTVKSAADEDRAVALAGRVAQVRGVTSVLKIQE
jgi:hyperosmotically inducible protein